MSPMRASRCGSGSGAGGSGCGSRRASSSCNRLASFSRACSPCASSATTWRRNSSRLACHSATVTGSCKPRGSSRCVSARLASSRARASVRSGWAACAATAWPRAAWKSSITCCTAACTLSWLCADRCPAALARSHTPPAPATSQASSAADRLRTTPALLPVDSASSTSRRVCVRLSDTEGSACAMACSAWSCASHPATSATFQGRFTRRAWLARSAQSGLRHWLASVRAHACACASTACCCAARWLARASSSSACGRAVQPHRPSAASGAAQRAHAADTVNDFIMRPL